MRRPRLAIVACCTVALLILAVGAVVSPQAAARAWLFGAVTASAAPLGALVLLMIGTLTRAGWAEAYKPGLLALADCVPWLWLVFAPVALALALIYPWANGQAPQHLQSWLSTPAFIARSGAALAGWTLIAALYRRRRASQRAAAIGLVFHALVLCIVPNDWILSLQPGWTTTDFPMAMLAAQLLAATSVLLLTPDGGERAPRDIASLQLAAILGLAYLTFMAFLIDWYGDLPDRVGWWIDRSAGGRWLLILAALGVGGGAPILANAWPHAGRRAAGALGLVGALLYFAWLFSPVFAGPSALFALAGLAAPAGVLACVAAGRGQGAWEAPVRG